MQFLLIYGGQHLDFRTTLYLCDARSSGEGNGTPLQYSCLPGKSHGRRSLVGRSPWGCTESDATEWFHFHFSLSCIGEGSGNPLQCSCLENPRDRGGWLAAVYGVAQSRTQLKRLSSNSSRSRLCLIVLTIHYNEKGDEITRLWIRCTILFLHLFGC